MPQRVDALRDLVSLILGIERGVVGTGALIEAFQSWDWSVSSLLEEIERRGGITTAELQRIREETERCIEVRNGNDPLADASTLGTASPVFGGETIGAEGIVSPTLPDAAATLSSDRTTEFSTHAFQQPAAPPPRFEILKEHAKGGLGVVFRALDRELNREVALKQIQNRHADNPTSRSRFLLEAEVTGGLEHPGIVPVYGLGLDGDGRPYYAMRFVRGDSLKDAIVAFHADDELQRDSSRRSLELRKLLRRFLDVCNTMEYAHGRGVLHRDIKPANIMVGKYGETLIVDWGIAKVGGRPEVVPDSVERVLRAKSYSGSTETLPGSAMGTPAYMSPEQAAGDLEQLGPASDVYSLGATLYHMLTGRAAFEDTELRVVLQKVKDGIFPEPRKLDRRIAPAMEAICLKAMKRDVADRYQSARALADDVERWMADEPVTARRDPFTERARRWMRRRRTTVTAAAASLMVAMTGLVVVVGVQQRANHNLYLAKERERDRFNVAMDAIRTFHTGVSQDFLLSQNEFTDQRKKLLRNAREFYRTLETKLAGDPDRSARKALGRAYYSVGDLTARIEGPEEALNSHKMGRDIRQKLAAENPSEPDEQADLADSLVAISNLDRISSRLDQAKETMDEALAIREGLAKNHPDDLTYQRDLGWCYHQLGDLVDKKGKPNNPLEFYEKARAIREILAKQNPTNAGLQADLAASLNTIGIYLSRTGRSEDGMVDILRARDIRKELVKLYPAEIEFQDSLARTYHNIGYYYSKTGQLGQAIEAYREASKIREALVQQFPAVFGLRTELAAVLSDTASRLYRIGQVTEALNAFIRARDIELRLHRDNPTITRPHVNLALSYDMIGIVLRDLGRSAEALENFQQSRSLMESLHDRDRALPEPRYHLAGIDGQLGQTLALDGRIDESLAAYAQSRTMLTELSRENPARTDYRRDLSQVLDAIGQIQLEQGEPEVALAVLEEASRLQGELVRADAKITDFREALAVSQERLALTLARVGQRDQALRMFEQARRERVALVEGNPGDVVFRQGEATNSQVLGDLNLRLGNPSEAVDAYRHALQLLDEQAKNNPELRRYRLECALVQKRLGDALRLSNQSALAVRAYREAIAMLSDGGPVGGADMEVLASAHAQLGRLAAASAPSAEPDDSSSEERAAITALRQAMTLGYRDVYHVATSPDYETLKDRPEFRDLFMDLAFPFDPFSAVRPE
ncbi:MAG: protein kinase [Isosphaeraceae bacterium]